MAAPFVYLFGAEGVSPDTQAVTFGSTRLCSSAGSIRRIPRRYLVLVLGFSGYGTPGSDNSKAVLAVILALMVIVLIVIAIAAFFFIAYSVITPVPVSTPE